MPLYFDNRGLTPGTAYVAWIDVMGTESIMLRSMMTVITFIGRLHVAALESCTNPEAVRLYPAMDGIYVVSTRQERDGGFPQEDHVSIV